ncbi:MAG: hypothetical protein ACK4YP_22405, partial [Myxococcota bacterium]
MRPAPLFAVLVLILAAIGIAGPARAAQKRSLGVPTALEGGAALQPWFTALRSAEQDRGVARALHYGDSTIAADGLARTVRARLAARFGDAGPGFVSGGFDPRWNERADVESTRAGEWTYKTILHGGAGGRYGLGGIVGIARAGASVTLSAVSAPKTPAPQRHLEIWYQAGEGYGTLWAKTDGREVLRQPAVAAATEDRRFTLDVPAGFSKLAFGAADCP